MLLVGETINAGNSTARVKNYYSANGLIVLMDVNGTFESGTTITGTDSGTVLTLSNFTINRDYDLGYEDLNWDNINAISLDNGSIIALDAHFTGKSSQDYQSTNVITI